MKDCERSEGYGEDVAHDGMRTTSRPWEREDLPCGTWQSEIMYLPMHWCIYEEEEEEEGGEGGGCKYAAWHES